MFSHFAANFVTTHVVRLKLFRLKAEGVRRARLPYFGGNTCPPIASSGEAGAGLITCTEHGFSKCAFP